MKFLSPTKVPGLPTGAVLQAQQDAIDQRIADQRRQEQQRQRHHQPAEHVLAVEPAGQRGSARRPRRAISGSLRTDMLRVRIVKRQAAL